MAHLQKFLLELGQGFAFVGEQVHPELGNQDYYCMLWTTYSATLTTSPPSVFCSYTPRTGYWWNTPLNPSMAA
jgi:hypothetical protein